MKHTDTRIYRRSIELAEFAHAVIEALPRGYAPLADQLRRAAMSVALNFAEGCGKQHPRDRRRYFLTARGSANEVAAIMDVARAFRVVADPLHAQTRDAADHVAAMLSRFR